MRQSVIRKIGVMVKDPGRQEDKNSKHVHWNVPRTQNMYTEDLQFILIIWNQAPNEIICD